MNTMIIDTHCHLYAQEFQDDLDAVIDRAVSAGVGKFYLPAIDSETTEVMLSLEARYPGQCFAMMGLHPCSVKDDYEAELVKVEHLLSTRTFSAIGETGLDFYWDKSFAKQQYIALERQASLALKYNIPIVLHTRDAMQETIDVIKNYVADGLRGVFHCFGGNLEEARQITDAGFYLGIGGVLTYKKSGLAEVLQEVDLRYLVLETDAPYLTPVPHRGKRNESSYISFVLDKLAEVKNVPREEVARVTTENAEMLFKPNL